MNRLTITCVVHSYDGHDTPADMLAWTFGLTHYTKSTRGHLTKIPVKHHAVRTNHVDKQLRGVFHRELKSAELVHQRITLEKNGGPSRAIGELVYLLEKELDENTIRMRLEPLLTNIRNQGDYKGERRITGTSLRVTQETHDVNYADAE